jgi:hypothetical protein
MHQMMHQMMMTQLELFSAKLFGKRDLFSSSPTYLCHFKVKYSDTSSASVSLYCCITFGWCCPYERLFAKEKAGSACALCRLRGVALTLDKRSI